MIADLLRTKLMRVSGPVKKAACWVGCLALFAGLSAGGYDWSPAVRDFALRGYAPNLFFATLFFPALYYVLADLGIQRVWRRVTCAFLGVVYAFPHCWLGTNRHFLFGLGRTFWEWQRPGMPAPEPDWFWGALHRLPAIPHEAPFFLLLLITGFLALRLWQKARPSAASPPWTRALPFVVLAMILLQTWLHLSLRSPYTYLAHYEQPAQNQYWYHDYLFAGAKGAVNADYPIYYSAELLFLGDASLLKVLPGRLFPMFISHPWSAFINPYYIWIVFNVAAWSLACVAIYHLALNEFGPRCAVFSTLFMASAQGLIVYVAQPAIYVFAIAGIAILLALQQRLFAPKRFRPAGALLFGAICALSLLTYENQPWLIGLALIAALRGFNLRWTVLSLLLAFLLYASFSIVMRHLPQLVPQDDMMGGKPWDTIKELVLKLQVMELLRRSLLSLEGFGVLMTHAFNLCLAPALCGLFLARSATRRGLVILAIGLPALLTYSYFELGANSFYTQFPRLVYQAYPLVYLLGGLCLAKLSEHPFSARWPRLGLWMAMLAVVLNFVWVNADVFGHPAIYFYWFYRQAGYA
jgi:hypothetical protein